MRFVRSLKVGNVIFAVFKCFCSFLELSMNVAAKPIIRYVSYENAKCLHCTKIYI